MTKTLHIRLSEELLTKVKEHLKGEASSICREALEKAIKRIEGSEHLCPVCGDPKAGKDLYIVPFPPEEETPNHNIFCFICIDCFEQLIVADLQELMEKADQSKRDNMKFQLKLNCCFEIENKEDLLRVIQSKVKINMDKVNEIRGTNMVRKAGKKKVRISLAEDYINTSKYYPDKIKDFKIGLGVEKGLSTQDLAIMIEKAEGPKNV